METEDGGTHPNVDNGTRVGHDGAGSGSGADARDLPGGELDLLGELVGGSCQDLQLLGQCCCCCLDRTASETEAAGGRSKSKPRNQPICCIL